MQRILFALLVACVPFLIMAQGEFSGGFKTGLNFSNFDGPSETDGENFELNTGFHIGATFIYSVTDLFGFKGELLYSQKGTQYSYDDQSYFIFYIDQTDQTIVANGNRRTDISISNSYIDIPLMVYYRLGKLELEAGVNAAFLIGSVGSGGLAFSGQTPSGSIVSEFTADIDNGYFRDDPGLASLFAADQFSLNTLTALRPTSVGAYYHGIDNGENLFNRIDLGLNAGLAFFLNNGLYLGVRANYGLSDVTNTDQDVAISKLGTNNELTTREDVDRNISLQASVGFRF